ncbi:MAG: monofunctional biosynthetic peptidoglycan transglycosylase [Nitrospirae bacterium]|nr:MAG: monofunctional biosynthetic peptidoglycan transglycosylase [Nitrospirota bacterium]
MSKSNLRRRLTRLLLRLLLLAALALGGIAGWWWLTFPDIAALAKGNPTTTALLEARAAAQREDRPVTPRWTWVPLSRISPHLQKAVIVSEDASFFQHEGFDWGGIQEATVRNIKSGKLARGGSTITQQLAKNLYLSSEKNLLRKVHEALIARSLERHLSKKRILEIYLNVAEWGQGVYGAEAAAQHHFGKPAAQLTEEEAALLAAILPSPLRHDPLKMTSYLAYRQAQILRWMH